MYERLYGSGPLAVTASVAAQNTWTDAAHFIGAWNLSISGTWAGTVTLQRSFDAGATWLDVETHTANTERQGVQIEDAVTYRIGIKTGEYTSGTAVVRLSQ